MISRTHIIHRCPSFNNRHGDKGLSEDQLKVNAEVHRDKGCSLEGKGRPNKQELLTNKYWQNQHINATSSKLANGVQTNGKYWANATVKTPARNLNTMYSEVGPNLLQTLSNQPDDGNLRLYRGMKTAEADKIMDWRSRKDEAERILSNPPTGYSATQFKNDNYIMPVSGHLGGYEQAQNYTKLSDTTMMEFKLKSGAHHQLFSPESMALAPTGRGAGRALNELHGPFPKASANEGALGGYVGLKPEQHGDFSMTVGNPASQLNFQLFVDDVRRSPEPPGSYGTPYSSSPASTSGFPPSYSHYHSGVNIVDAEPDDHR